MRSCLFFLAGRLTNLCETFAWAWARKFLTLGTVRNHRYIRITNISVPGKYQSVPRPGTILAFIFSTVVGNRVIARLIGVT